MSVGNGYFDDEDEEKTPVERRVPTVPPGNVDIVKGLQNLGLDVSALAAELAGHSRVLMEKPITSRMRKSMGASFRKVGASFAHMGNIVDPGDDVITKKERVSK